MCGIVAYTGSKKPNFAAMKFMMILQKKRGNDGVGFVYNNIRITSHDDPKDLSYDRGDPENFFSKWYFSTLKNKKIFLNNTVLIHNRSRSKGAYGRGAIHPWVYEKDGVKHYFAHNGTLSNEDDIQKKYGLQDLKFESDTHLLGYIIVNFGFDVLTQYHGTAAFVYMREDEPNVLYVWKGASKHSYNSHVVEEERPLHYCEVESGVYIASLFNTLQCGLDMENDYIFEVEDNNLIKFDYSSKKLEKTITVYDRSHIEKPVFTTNLPAASTTHGGKGGFQGTLPLKITCNKNITEDAPKNHANGKIYYHAGKYFKNGHAYTTGEEGIRVENDGTISSKSKTVPLGHNEYILYFMNGLLLRDRDAFLAVKALCPDKKILKESYNIIASYLHPDYALIWFESGLEGFSDKMNVIINNNVLRSYLQTTNIPFSYGTYAFRPYHGDYDFTRKNLPTLMGPNKPAISTGTYNNYRSNHRQDLLEDSSLNSIFSDKNEAAETIPFDYKNFKKNIIVDSFNSKKIDQLLETMDNTLEDEQQKYQEELLKILNGELKQITTAIEDLYNEKDFDDLDLKNKDAKTFSNMMDVLFFCIKNPTKAIKLLKIDEENDH